MFGKKNVEKEIYVEGMHCAHCAKSVTDSLKKIKGVKKVDVDVSSGKVVIESKTALDDAQIKTAVENVGYSVK